MLSEHATQRESGCTADAGSGSAPDPGQARRVRMNWRLASPKKLSVWHHPSMSVRGLVSSLGPTVPRYHSLAPWLSPLPENEPVTRPGAHLLERAGLDFGNAQRSVLPT
jgi:hypothetical protein